jgi:hypothetical protein
MSSFPFKIWENFENHRANLRHNDSVMQETQYFCYYYKILESYMQD